MIERNGISAGEIGDRPRHTNHAVKGAGGHVEPLRGSFEQAPAAGIERRELLELRSRQVRIHARAAWPRQLTFACGEDPRSHG